MKIFKNLFSGGDAITENSISRNYESSVIRSAFTFRRILPLVLLTMIFVLAVRQSVSLDPDLWWHLKAGEHIASTYSVPHVDDFSFTKQGSEWVAHEWLSELLIYGIFRLSGLVGLVVIFSLLIVSVFWMIYQRCAGRPYAACLAVLLASAASSPLFGIRPQMITLLFASIFVALLERYLSDGQNKHLWWFVPMMALWVNLHAGFALGLILVALYFVCAILDGKSTCLRPLGITLIACVAIVPLNPNGIRMFTYPYETLTSPSMGAFIEEWASPDFHTLTYLPLAILLLATFAVLALSPKRVSAGDLFLVLITAFGALRSVRHIPIFALFAAPTFAKHLWSVVTVRGWDKWLTGEESKPNAIKLFINAVLLIAPLILGVVRVWDFASHEKAYEEIRNPVAAVDFLKSQHLPGPIYNRYGWGGYLIYRLYPDYRVYIDGRADVYGDRFFAETMSVYDGVGDWKNILDARGVNTILISANAPLANVLRSATNWRMIYENGESVIYCRVSSILQ